MARIKQTGAVQSLADRVRQRLTATGKSARGAALEAGLSSSTVRHILDGNSASPRGDTLTALAGVLKTTEAWLLHGDSVRKLAVATRAEEDAGSARELLADVALPPSAGRMPVYAAVENGSDGSLRMDIEPVDWMPRPSILEFVKSAYGLIVAGSSMTPAYQPGDLALVNPKLVPYENQDGLLVGAGEVGQDHPVMIRELVRSTDEQWIVRQYLPVKEARLSRTTWPRIHRIVGRFNRN